MMKKILFAALAAGFLFFGFSAYVQSQASPKNKRVYQAIHHYSPYYIEKRFGGLQLRSKTNKAFKEKPSNMEVFHRLDTLEQEWGKDHLQLENGAVVIRDKNGTTLGTVPLKTDKEKQFVHTFYGL